jgi:hemoglobin/transferrin/lactoferrin receptor protein
VITEHDRNMNRHLRDGYRSELSLSGKLEYEPVDKLKFWVGGRYNNYISRDRNAKSTPRREDVYGRWIYLNNGKERGWMFWKPDADGNFTDATDPRLNNGIVFQDTNNPFDGVSYNEFGANSERVYAPGTSNMVVGFDRSQQPSQRDNGLSPGIGVNYEIAPQTLLYASYTQGLRLPSLFETSLGTPSVDPVSGLKPERSHSWEIGASTTKDSLFATGDSLSLKLALFDNYVEDYITRYYDPVAFGPMKFTNADSYRTSGLEFQSSYDNGRIFADLSATYYLRTETCDEAFADYLRANAGAWLDTGDTPDCTPGSYMGSYANTQNPPKVAVNLTIGGRFLEDRLTLGGRMTHTSGPTEKMDKPWQDSATTPQLVYHPVTVFDAFLTYKMNDNAVLNASVDNITDRYYLDPLAHSFMPAPGRTFRAGLTFKF